MTEAIVRPGRGRRPSAEVRRDVLAAATELLLTDGVAAVTFERVAQAAPASKVTLYKWWPTPGALAAEAYFAHVESGLRFDDSGDLAADLRAQLHAFVATLTDERIGPVIAGFIGAAQADAALAAAWSAGYSLERRRLAVERFARAEEAGQLRAGLDLEVLVDQLWGACYHRLLVRDQPLTPAFADAILDNLLRGVAIAP
ncbi:TetR/AcrR family transcriptional regulator [Herbiconiux sp.]|uniref:TetR/AcrR family transcriptional regulator n=1 Tax=Herbiconiux sp. TaxID=1871186 RepID=UPI0025C049A3|nr:TetR/AcrR family transcriptional regulator [Herbiconiux sp.]